MPTVAEQLVQQQVEAYNAHDIDRFAACYAPEIEIRALAANELLVSGQAALRERYLQRFASPNLHCHIANRIVLGDFVIDHEELTGIAEGQIRQAVVIYQVEAGLIRRTWILQS